MEQNLFNQNNQLEPIKPSNIKFEYTTKQIADGFECSETTIRDSKSNNKDYFIEGIDWNYEGVGTPTGLQKTVLWSKEGIIKLATKLKLTPKAIDFLIEIRSEEKAKFNVPKTYSEALRLAADQQEQLDKQQLQLEEQKPKVEYYDLVEESKTGIYIGTFAKLIKWDPEKLFKWLRDNGYLFYKNRENIPYQKYVKLGYFDVKQIPDRLSNRIYSTTLITGKGQIYIAGKLK